MGGGGGGGGILSVSLNDEAVFRLSFQPLNDRYKRKPCAPLSALPSIYVLSH